MSQLDQFLADIDAMHARRAHNQEVAALREDIFALKNHCLQLAHQGKVLLLEQAADWAELQALRAELARFSPGHPATLPKSTWANSLRKKVMASTAERLQRRQGGQSSSPQDPRPQAQQHPRG